jgi:hypothetical protein
MMPQKFRNVDREIVPFEPSQLIDRERCTFNCSPHVSPSRFSSFVKSGVSRHEDHQAYVSRFLREWIS